MRRGRERIEIIGMVSRRMVLPIKIAPCISTREEHGFVSLSNV